ncbi:MAG: hypothetical protein GC191_10480 [Azospirillum sp.]|nr:hypothetical protein [Azospirillum sp.]
MAARSKRPKLLSTVTAAALALTAAICPQLTAGAADAESDDFYWYQSDFDAVLERCHLADQRPSWCQSWVDAMEAARPKEAEVSQPEWRRMTFARGLEICAVPLLPPDWCGAWHAAMKQVSEQPPYSSFAGGLAARRAQLLAEIAEAARVWRELVQRAGLNRLKPEDFQELDRRIEFGDDKAMELQAWLYFDGRGVKKDFARAYEYYFKAVRAGRTDLVKTLDQIWPRLRQHEQEQIAREFARPK